MADLTISLAAVKTHNKKDDCWIVIDNMVCDVTKFLKEHPGGSDVILDFAGKDATESFNDVGHSNDAKQMLTEYKIGVLSEVEITKKDSKKKDGDGCAIM